MASINFCHLIVEILDILEMFPFLLSLYLYLYNYNYLLILSAFMLLLKQVNLQYWDK